MTDYLHGPGKRPTNVDFTLTEIERDIFEEGLTGTVEGIKREWFDRGMRAREGEWVHNVDDLAALPVETLVVAAGGLVYQVAADGAGRRVIEIGRTVGIPTTDARRHHLLPMRVLHRPTGACGECNTPGDFAWDTGYPFINGGPVKTCAIHGLPAPGWAYDQ